MIDMKIDINKLIADISNDSKSAECFDSEKFFSDYSMKIFKTHEQMMDQAFNFILENAIPNFMQRYFSIIGQPSNLTYSCVKKHEKLTKYQQVEFIKN